MLVTHEPIPDSTMIFIREWKSLPNCLTSDKKIIIHGNERIVFISYMLFYVMNPQIS